MTTKLLVTADLGHLKVYRIEEDAQFSAPRTRLIEERTTEAVLHLSEAVTDQAGQFRKGSFPAGPTEGSDGEPHNLALERRRRALKTVAREISNLVSGEGVQAWYLAAPKEINRPLVAALDRVVREKIEENVELDLAKLKLEEVLSHFYKEKKTMAGNKGKPSGKYAETKTDPGRKGDYKRSGWPEEAATQHVQNATGQQPGLQSETNQLLQARGGEGRNRKAGAGPVSNERANRRRSAAGTLGFNRSNVRRKPSARRTSPFKKMMRKQKISPQLAQVMRDQPDKGDRRRTAAQRKLKRNTAAKVGKGRVPHARIV